jgi:hypothetical protein
MLIHAFAGEIIERIKCEPARAVMDKLVWDRLEANPHLLGNNDSGGTPCRRPHFGTATLPSLPNYYVRRLNDLYQQVILDHCKKPRNFHEMPQATCSAQGHNPLCGDKLKLFLTLDGDVIKDASFVGSGCCISKASASLLTEFVKGKPRPRRKKCSGRCMKWS